MGMYITLVNGFMPKVEMQQKAQWYLNKYLELCNND